MYAPRMAEGPRLPKKDTALRHSRQALKGVAYQIGALLAIQRNRHDLTQWDLAEELGIDRLAISRAENGEPCGLTNPQIAALFERLDLDGEAAHANFVKWWQKNHL
jgi:DNA-binding XRE family transcriptional regulator